MKDYQSFIESKRQRIQLDGFEPLWLPDFLFPFQRHLTEWAVRKGRAAIFADCGLGKTPMQLVWAENVVRKTGGRVLILAPLAVTMQTVREGGKFGVECRQSRDGKIRSKITVTNYEQLHRFDSSDFEGVVCDESSAIKHFTSQRQKYVTEFLRKMQYRLLCTATPSPNDYIELGTSSEALGQLGRMDMLAKFFKNDEGSLHPMWYGSKWRLKGHSSQAFWRWVCSWARAIRRPSDLGYENDGFILPPLNMDQVVVDGRHPRKGFGFNQARTLEEQRTERRNTIEVRCGEVARIVSRQFPSIAWCHLNAEGDLLERLIPGAVQVSGNDSDGAKEEKFLAFVDGKVKTLVTKPKIGGFGMNWEHCSNMTFFPTNSFEQYYQAVRRCWRYGQKKPVQVTIVTSPGESRVLRNLQRKAKAAEEMFSILVVAMNDELRIRRPDLPDGDRMMPPWLGGDGSAVGGDDYFQEVDDEQTPSYHPVRDTSSIGKGIVGMSRTAWGNYNASGKRGPNPHKQR